MSWNHATPVEMPDWVNVERLTEGGDVQPSCLAELHAAMDILEARGLTSREIASRLGCARRTVQRHRARRRG
jgi:FixJ family two-component response regulator